MENDFAVEVTLTLMERAGGLLLSMEIESVFGF